MAHRCGLVYYSYSVRCPAVHGTPVTFANVHPFPEFPAESTALLRTNGAYACPLPALPCVRSGAAVMPLHYFSCGVFRVNVAVMYRPASSMLHRIRFRPDMTLAAAATNRILSNTFRLKLAFLVGVGAAFAINSSMRKISGVLLTTSKASFYLLFICFRRWLLFCGLKGAVASSLHYPGAVSGSRAVVNVTSGQIPPTFRFLIRLVGGGVTRCEAR